MMMVLMDTDGNARPRARLSLDGAFHLRANVPQSQKSSIERQPRSKSFRQRELDATQLRPDTDAHRAIMKEIAQLRIYAEARQWIVWPTKQRAERSSRPHCDWTRPFETIASSRLNHGYRHRACRDHAENRQTSPVTLPPPSLPSRSVGDVSERKQPVPAYSRRSLHRPPLAVAGS